MGRILDFFWRKRTESDVVRRYARALASSLQRKYVEFSSVAEQREGLDVALLCFHRVPRLRGVVGGSEDELVKELSSAGLSTMSTENMVSAVRAFRKYKGYQEVFDAYVALLSQELLLYSETRDQLQSVQSSLSRALDMNISADLKRVMSQIASSLLTLQNYVELHVALVRRTQLDCQSPGTVEELQQDVTNTAHLDRQAEQTYASLLGVLRSYFPREKVSFERAVGSSNTTRSPIAAGLLLALTLFSSACEMSSAQNVAPPAQTRNQEEALHEEPLQVMSFSKNHDVFSSEVDNDGRTMYVLAGDTKGGSGYMNRLRLYIARVAGKDIREVGVTPLEPGNWRLIRGGHVYVYHFGGPSGPVYLLQNGQAVPIQGLETAGDEVQVRPSAQGDVFVTKKPRSAKRHYWLRAENNTVISLQDVEPSQFVNVNTDEVLGMVPSQDGRYLATTIQTSSDDGSSWKLVLSRKDGAQGAAKMIDGGRGILIQSETVSFDDSGKYLAYVRLDASGQGNELPELRVYDIVRGQIIFRTFVKEKNFTTSDLVQWLPGSSILLFTKMNGVRFQRISRLTINDTAVVCEDNVIGQRGEDVTPKIEIPTISVKQIVVDKTDKNHVYLINGSPQGSECYSIRLDR